MTLANDLPHFKFVGKLGTGGTAQVYKILTTENKTAALKVILNNQKITKEEFQKLAFREKTILTNIDFPGIVKLYDVQTEYPSYICLEYCSGKTLEQYNKIQDITTALNILSSIAVNLEFLQLKSIVHADLKPDNIFMPEDISIFSSNRLTFSKLSDFSLGKFVHEDDSVRGGVGTIGYMAPETITKNQVTHQSDLFSLGVIAYQILTGVHPFITEDSDPLKINSRVLEEEPIALNNLRANISDKIVQIVSQLLEKDSIKRIQSAWDVCLLLRDAGATYPFEKVLNPKYAITFDKEYSENTTVVANHHERLDTISGKDNKMLRLILSDNFDKGNIIYDKRQFHFNSNPLVSSYMIRASLYSFSHLSYSKKKSTIEFSLQKDKQNLISSLLPQLLHPTTIKKTALRLATKFENENKYALATRLYLFAGDLLKSENTAYQAAMEYKNRNKIDCAIELLQKVISYGKLLNREYELKSLYMVKGDFLKDIGEADRAEVVYNEIIALYHNKDVDELLAETYKDLGDLYKMTKKPDDGIKSLEKALEIFKKLENELEISKTYNNLGNIYTVANNYETALPYFRKALKIQRKLSVAEEVASTLNNIGAIYGMTGKFRKALKIFKISLKIKKEIGNKGEIARSLNNIGFCYEVLGDPQKAIDMYEKSLAYNKELDSKKEILINLENLTVIMFTSEKLKESVGYIKDGINLAIEINNNPHIGLFNLYLGAVLFRMGKLTEAENSFKTVEKVFQSIEDDTLRANLYLEKAEFASLINNKAMADNLLEKAYAINSKTQDKTNLINVLLSKFSLLNDLSLLPEAEEIIKDLQLSKEKTILHALLLDYCLLNDNSYNVQTAYEYLKETLKNPDKNIIQCRQLISISKYELHLGNISQALSYITQSIQLSKTRGLLFDRFHSLVLYGEILGKQKDYEQCYSIYKEALEISKSIFTQLETDEDKLAFQSKQEFIFLTSEIKKLTKIIGQKKEQIY